MIVCAGRECARRVITKPGLTRGFDSLTVTRRDTGEHPRTRFGLLEIKHVYD